MDVLDTNKLLSLHDEYNKVLGPYIRKSDNRRIVVLTKYGSSYKTPNRTTTLSYAKALMEVKLNRTLKFNEVVHHKDGNKLNDSLDNIEIVDREYHSRSHFLKYSPYTVTCEVCGKEFEVSHQHHTNHEKGDCWCCSKRCSGILGGRKSYARVVE